MRTVAWPSQHMVTWLSDHWPGTGLTGAARIDRRLSAIILRAQRAAREREFASQKPEVATVVAVPIPVYFKKVLRRIAGHQTDNQDSGSYLAGERAPVKVKRIFWCIAGEFPEVDYFRKWKEERRTSVFPHC